MKGDTGPAGRCQLCGRDVAHLTRHHLIPRTRHSNRRNKREFARAEVHARVAWLCRPCHDHVHSVFSEKTLEREFNTLDRLRADEEIRRFVDWIGDRPVSFRPPRGRRRKPRR